MFKTINKAIQTIYYSALSYKNSALKAFDILGYDALNSIGWHDVKATLAWQYWARVHVITRSVDLIASGTAAINILLEDTQTGEKYREYDPKIPATNIFKILKKPNSDKTYNEFICSNISSLIVTGETYIRIVRSDRKSDTAMLFWENPADIIVMSDGFYMPYQIILTKATETITYTRENLTNRYFDPSGKEEIYQIIDFNPFYKYGNQRGFSSLSSIYFAIEAYIKGNTHNIGILTNGVTPSGVLLVDSVVKNEQLEEAKKKIKKQYSGSNNVGKIMVFNKGREFKPMNMSNKDMDFAKLNEQAKQSMYETFEIPASFYDPKSSTYNNKLNDRINLYIFAIIPMATRFFEELTKMFFAEQYDDRYKITFLLREIPALELLFDESILRKRETGIYTLNELRDIEGLEDVGKDGDVIYQPIALAPIGSTSSQNQSIKASNLDKALKALNKGGQTNGR